MAQKMQDRIREQAYFMWVNDGCQEGREMDYWLAAEQNVAGSKKKAAPKKKAVAVVSSGAKKKTAAPRKVAAKKK